MEPPEQQEEAQQQQQTQMPPISSPVQQPAAQPAYQPYAYPLPYYPPPYYPPPYYPPPYYPPRQQTDTPLIALVCSLVGLVYSCPPFVLPIVSLYLVHKAQQEMAAGTVFSPSSGSFLKVARVLAIIALCLHTGIVLLYAFIFLGSFAFS